MKKVLNRLAPLFFAMFSFLFYILIYRPPIKSMGFTTACLVFCAALCWSAVIILFHRRQNVLMYTYVAISLLIPLLLLEAFHLLPLDRLWHRTILGLLIVSTISLFIFMTCRSPRIPDQEVPDTQ